MDIRIEMNEKLKTPV